MVIGSPKFSLTPKCWSGMLQNCFKYRQKFNIEYSDNFSRCVVFDSGEVEGAGLEECETVSICKWLSVRKTNCKLVNNFQKVTYIYSTICR